MKIIFDYMKTLYDPEKAALYPDAETLLTTLSAKHELFLVTSKSAIKKENAVLEQIKPLFKEIIFVEKKSPETFQQIAGEEKMVIVVGDSMNDEMKIGIELRLITVHIKQRNSAQDYSFKQPTYRIAALNEMLEIIANYDL